MEVWLPHKHKPDHQLRLKKQNLNLFLNKFNNLHMLEVVKVVVVVRKTRVNLSNLISKGLEAPL